MFSDEPGYRPLLSGLVLLPGFLVGGVGYRVGQRAPGLDSRLDVVRVERAGMAPGINNTFRQVGIATGIAALGAIFQSHVHAKVVSALAGLPNAGAIAHSFSNGQQAQAIAAAPAGLREHLTEVAKASFVSGFHDILRRGRDRRCSAALSSPQFSHPPAGLRRELRGPPTRRSPTHA